MAPQWCGPSGAAALVPSITASALAGARRLGCTGPPDFVSVLFERGRTPFVLVLRADAAPRLAALFRWRLPLLQRPLFDLLQLQGSCSAAAALSAEGSTWAGLMALCAAATAAAGRAAAAPARLAEAGGIGVATAASIARSAKPAGASELWSLGRSSSNRSSRVGCRPASRIAVHSLMKRQQHKQQQQQRLESSCCGPLFCSADRETQAAAFRQETAGGQTVDAAAQTASSLPAAAAALHAGAADRSRAEGRLAQQAPEAASRRRAGALGVTSTTASSSGKAGGPTEATVAAGEGTAEAAAMLKGCGSAWGLAARLRLAVSAAGVPATIQSSSITDKSVRQSPSGQHFCRMSRATEMRPACGVPTSEVVGVADKLLHPLSFVLSQPRCTYTPLAAGAPTRSLSSSSPSGVSSALATLFLPPATQPHPCLSLPSTAAAAPRAAAASPAGLAPRFATTSHKPVSCTAAVAVPGAATAVAACGRAAAAAASCSARLLPVVFRRLKSTAAAGNSEVAGSLPAAVGVRTAALSVPTVRHCAAARSMTSAAASAAAAGASAAGAACAGAAAMSPGTDATAPVAGSRKAVAALPLGSLYSKTHEYVHLLLEFVEPADDSMAAAATAAAAGKRRGGGDAADSPISPSPRRCRLVGFVGISAHAAEELGEVVYCEYTRPLAAAAAAAAESGGTEAATRGDPQQQRVHAGRAGGAEGAEEGAGEETTGGAEQKKMWVRRGSPICSLESVKSVAEIYSPVEGVVLEINAAAAEEPGVVWRHSEGDGWLVKLLLPLPAGRTTDSNSDDEVNAAYALHLTDVDIAKPGAAPAAAAPPTGATAVGGLTAAAEAAPGGGPAAAEAAAGDEAAEETYAFMQACRECQRLQDALLGLRRRLMGPEQYVQFVEREKKATGTTDT